MRVVWPTSTKENEAYATQIDRTGTRETAAAITFCVFRLTLNFCPRTLCTQSALTSITNIGFQPMNSLSPTLTLWAGSPL